jgi:hypothetical protein
VAANAYCSRIGQNATGESNRTVHAHFEAPVIELLSSAPRATCVRIVHKDGSVSLPASPSDGQTVPPPLPDHYLRPGADGCQSTSSLTLHATASIASRSSSRRLTWSPTSRCQKLIPSSSRRTAVTTTGRAMRFNWWLSECWVSHPTICQRHLAAPLPTWLCGWACPHRRSPSTAIECTPERLTCASLKSVGADNLVPTVSLPAPGGLYKTTNSHPAFTAPGRLPPILAAAGSRPGPSALTSQHSGSQCEK